MVRSIGTTISASPTSAITREHRKALAQISAAGAPRARPRRSPPRPAQSTAAAPPGCGRARSRRRRQQNATAMDMRARSSASCKQQQRQREQPVAHDDAGVLQPPGGGAAEHEHHRRQHAGDRRPARARADDGDRTARRSGDAHAPADRTCAATAPDRTAPTARTAARRSATADRQRSDARHSDRDSRTATHPECERGGEEAEEGIELVLGIPRHDAVGEDPAAHGDEPDRDDERDPAKVSVRANGLRSRETGAYKSRRGANARASLPSSSAILSRVASYLAVVSLRSMARARPLVEGGGTRALRCNSGPRGHQLEGGVSAKIRVVMPAESAQPRWSLDTARQ